MPRRGWAWAAGMGSSDLPALAGAAQLVTWLTRSPHHFSYTTRLPAAAPHPPNAATFCFTSDAWPWRTSLLAPCAQTDLLTSRPYRFWGGVLEGGRHACLRPLFCTRHHLTMAAEHRWKGGRKEGETRPWASRRAAHPGENVSGRRRASLPTTACLTSPSPPEPSPNISSFRT